MQYPNFTKKYRTMVIDIMKKVLITISVILFSIFVFNPYASANEQNNKPPLTITPILPENQDKGISNYFSITTDSNDLKQDLEFLITNNTDEKIKLYVLPLNALTSPNGVIQYRQVEREENSILIDKKYGLKNYIEIDDKYIEINTGETKSVVATIDISEIEGTILGAVGFQLVTGDEEQPSDENQFQIKNKVNYIVGIQINFHTEQEPNFIIGTPFIDVMPSYYAIRLPITQEAPLLVKDVSLEYEVWNYQSEKIFGSEIKNLYNFAPKTKTNIALPWDHDEIEQDKTYILKGKLKYKDKNNAIKEIDFTREFIFNGDSSLKYKNIRDLETPVIKSSFNWLWLLLLLIPLIVYFTRKNRYVIFSDSTEMPIIINKDHELFEQIKPEKEAYNADNQEYKHYYKQKRKNSDDYYYQYIKTKSMKIKNS